MGVDCFHTGKYFVTFKRGFEDCKKDVIITIEKVFEKDSLRIILSDEDDPSFLCVLQVTRTDYEDLKKQQGLLIDFDNFASQLVRLLQQCSCNNMFLLLQQGNPAQYQLEFVEHNEFRRLVHLALRAAPATERDVVRHMSDTVGKLKRALATAHGTLSNTEKALGDKCAAAERRLLDLGLRAAQLEADQARREAEHQEQLQRERDRHAQDKLQWHKSHELHTKAQVASVQELVARRDRQIEELGSTVRLLKENTSKLEGQLSDKSMRLSVLDAELQKSHLELAATGARLAAAERDLADRERRCAQAGLRCSDMEKAAKENIEKIADLNNSLHHLRTEKQSLEERLGLSEALAARHADAARHTAEQLAKANQIIAKMNGDLAEIKDKLLCRTEIALAQEKVVERNTKEIENLKTDLNKKTEHVDKLTSELDALREKYENCEKSLKDKEDTIKNNNMVIHWLHKKMEECTLSDPAPAPAPAPGPAARASAGDAGGAARGGGDDSVDFYATSKLSDLDNSPGPSATRRAALDPRYLRPAGDDPPAGRRGTSRSTATTSSKGKENLNFNLPTVDYREKKSSKPSTFRATPVSAYFP